MAMYHERLELLPASNFGATVESGTDSGSTGFAAFASGMALDSAVAVATARRRVSVGATDTAAAAAAALLAPAFADEVFGGSATATRCGSADQSTQP